jgi:hypothetical protein
MEIVSSTMFGKEESADYEMEIWVPIE